MAYRGQGRLISLTLLLLLIAHYGKANDEATPPNSEEDDDSSSEETVEDSNESRRKRSIEELPSENVSKDVGEGKTTARAGIPGLPDPETILKVAEIFQTVGEKVIPILVAGNSAVNLVPERKRKNLLFLQNFKKDLDKFFNEMKNK